MALSYRTQNRLASLIQAIAEAEKKTEVVRQVLAEQKQFEPHTAFRRLDLTRDGYISSSELIEFLTQNNIVATTQESLALFAGLDYNEDGLISYNDFVQAILPQEDEKLRTLATLRESYYLESGEPLPYEVEWGLTRVLEQEIKNFRNIENLKDILAASSDFNTLDAFNTIDEEMLGYIDYECIEKFQRGANKILSDDEILAFLRVVGDNSRVTYTQFSNAIGGGNKLNITSSPSKYDRISSPLRTRQQYQQDLDDELNRSIRRSRQIQLENDIRESQDRLNRSIDLQRSQERISRIDRQIERQRSRERIETLERDLERQRSQDRVDRLNRSIERSQDLNRSLRKLELERSQDRLNRSIEQSIDLNRSIRQLELNRSQERLERSIRDAEIERVVRKNELERSIRKSEIEREIRQAELQRSQDRLQRSIGRQRSQERLDRSIRQIELERSQERLDRSLRQVELERSQERLNRSIRDNELLRSQERLNRSMRQAELDRSVERLNRSVRQAELERSAERMDRQLRQNELERSADRLNRSIERSRQIQLEADILRSQREREQSQRELDYELQKSLDRSRRIESQILDASLRNSVYDTPSRNEESYLVKALKEQINQEREIEEIRKQLALKIDFNMLDAFRIFDIQGRGYVTKLEIEQVLNECGIYPTKDEMYLFFKRYDSDSDGLLRYSEFTKIVSPQSSEYTTLMSNRAPHYLDSASGFDTFEYDTRFLFKKLLNKALHAEVEAEALRQNLSRRPNFSVTDAFNALDSNENGLITIDEFKSFLNDWGFYVSSNDLISLISRYDKNNDGKISYGEFLSEITPKSPLKY